MSQMLGIRPIKLTLLSGGTFLRFYNEKQKSGVDLAHLKPPHMNPSDDILALLTAKKKTPIEVDIASGTKETSVGSQI